MENNTEVKRDPKGLFVKGTVGGPGRKKGKSLKEYWRQRFSEMTDEEKLKFSKTVSPELLWQMAEGRPSQSTHLDGGEDEQGKPLPILFNLQNVLSDDGDNKDSKVEETP